MFVMDRQGFAGFAAQNRGTPWYCQQFFPGRGRLARASRPSPASAPAAAAPRRERPAHGRPARTTPPRAHSSPRRSRSSRQGRRRARVRAPRGDVTLARGPSPINATARGRDQREGNQIDAVVLENRFEGVRVALADKAEVARRNFEARDITDAVVAREMPLEHRQSTTVVVQRRAGNGRALLPQAARRMQHVEMRQVAKVKREAVKEIPRFDQRQIESPAVEGERACRPRVATRSTSSGAHVRARSPEAGTAARADRRLRAMRIRPETPACRHRRQDPSFPNRRSRVWWSTGVARALARRDRAHVTPRARPRSCRGLRRCASRPWRRSAA